MGIKGARTVPVAEFHVLPAVDPRKETVLEQGELVTGISLPAPAKGLRSSYRKVRARQSWDFALVGVAMAIAFDKDKVSRARVVLSGVAPVPWRSKAVEDTITGRRLDAESIKLACDAVVRNAQPLEQNDYKVPLLSGLMGQELRAIAV
jgi:xanthine dehydrogenase YagS FAD-binding subunit